MAFGDSAKKLADNASSNKKSTAFTTIPQFMKIPQGETIFRLFPDETEVQWREYWLEVPVTSKNAQGDEVTVRANRSLILAVTNPDTGYFEYAESGQDPLTEWYYSMDEDERKAKKLPYIRTRFAINAINRNLVTKDASGNVVPSENGSPWNIVQILSHSGGKEGGKHTLQAIKDCIGNMRNKNAKPAKPHELDLRIIRSGTGMMDTRYLIYPGNNSDDIDFDTLSDQRFDLVAHYQPFPFEAIEDLRQGMEWNETLARYNISKFPRRFNETSTIDSDEDLPF